MIYLLDPSQDHGLGSQFLEKIAREAFPDIDQVSLDTAKVEPERVLGDKGNVDLLIKLGDKVLAIEVKIWDRSAKMSQVRTNRKWKDTIDTSWKNSMAKTGNSSS